MILWFILWSKQINFHYQAKDFLFKFSIVIKFPQVFPFFYWTKENFIPPVSHCFGMKSNNFFKKDKNVHWKSPNLTVNSFQQNTSYSCVNENWHYLSIIIIRIAINQRRWCAWEGECFYMLFFSILDENKCLTEYV